MKNWTIKNDGSEDFRNIVIPYLSHKHGKNYKSMAKWYSEINGKLKISLTRPDDAPRIDIYEFCAEIIGKRNFKKGEKVMVQKLGSYVEGKYIESYKDPNYLSRRHVIEIEGEIDRFAERYVFQKPQKAKKTKKKKKFKNGERIIIYKGEPCEAMALYIGKCPYGVKDRHVVDVDRECEPRYVLGKFITKRK